MKGIPITSIGVKVSWAKETTSGTRPTTGYAVIPDITSVPDFNPEPEMLETTTMSDLTNKTYTAGLRDYGSSLEFSANISNMLVDIWGEFVEAYTTGLESNTGVWLCIDIPNLDFSYFLPCEPQEIGLDSFETSSVISTTLRVSLRGDMVKDTNPTYADEA